MYMNFIFSEAYKKDKHQSSLLLKRVCQNKGVRFETIDQACDALGIKIFKNQSEITINIPNETYGDCQIAMVHLQQEILNAPKQGEAKNQIFLNDHKKQENRHNPIYPKQLANKSNVFAQTNFNSADEELNLFAYTLTSTKNPNVFSSQVILPSHINTKEMDIACLKAIANRTLKVDFSVLSFIEQYLQKNITQLYQDKLTCISMHYLKDSPKAYLVVCTQDQELLEEAKQMIEPLGFLVCTR